MVPENGVVGLHAGDLNLESVKVDGETVEFDYYPVHRRLGDESRWAAVTCPNSAADAAASVYMSSLAHEMDANLIVYCGTSPKPENSAPVLPLPDSKGHTLHEVICLVMYLARLLGIEGFCIQFGC